MIIRPLGKTGLAISPIGFGAFKIGRNEKTKYSQAYPLPDDRTVERLLNGVLDLGVTHIDTAPAYGLSEELIGRSLAHRRKEFTLSSKVGEIFEQGQSRYDFSDLGVRSSVEQSLRRLRTDVVDLLFIHSHGADVEIQQSSDVVPTLCELKRQDWCGRWPFGEDRGGAVWPRMGRRFDGQISPATNHAGVIAAAAERGWGDRQKGLASGGSLPTRRSFVLANPASPACRRWIEYRPPGDEYRDRH